MLNIIHGTISMLIVTGMQNTFETRDKVLDFRIVKKELHAASKQKQYSHYHNYAHETTTRPAYLALVVDVVEVLPRPRTGGLALNVAEATGEPTKETSSRQHFV